MLNKVLCNFKNINLLQNTINPDRYLHPELLSGHDVVQEVPHLEGGQVEELVGGVIVVLQVKAEKKTKSIPFQRGLSETIAKWIRLRLSSCNPWFESISALFFIV